MHRATKEPWLHVKKIRSVWPTFGVKIARRKKWAWIDIFKPVLTVNGMLAVLLMAHFNITSGVGG